jgi:hypothetical protein
MANETEEEERNEYDLIMRYLLRYEPMGPKQERRAMKALARALGEVRPVPPVFLYQLSDLFRAGKVEIKMFPQNHLRAPAIAEDISLRLGRGEVNAVESVAEDYGVSRATAARAWAKWKRAAARHANEVLANQARK